MELLQEEANLRELTVLLNEGLPGTRFIFYNKFDKKLSSKPNVLATFDPSFFEFVMNAPFLLIKPADVQMIKSDNFEQLKEQLTQLMAQQLEEMKNNYEKVITEQRSHFESMLTQQQVQQEELRSHIQGFDEIKFKHDQEMRERKEEIESLRRQSLKQVPRQPNLLEIILGAFGIHI